MSCRNAPKKQICSSLPRTKVVVYSLELDSLLQLSQMFILATKTRLCSFRTPTSPSSRMLKERRKHPSLGSVAETFIGFRPPRLRSPRLISFFTLRSQFAADSPAPFLQREYCCFTMSAALAWLATDSNPAGFPPPIFPLIKLAALRIRSSS